MGWLAKIEPCEPGKNIARYIEIDYDKKRFQG